ncbi:MAG: lysoplasmalogenase [Flavobacteriales bacterium]|nr:lysoplasmalogenase [Flavobacteriales bacterium]
MDPRKSLLINGGLYLAALVGTLYAQARGLHLLEFICKPMLLLVLSSWFFFNSRRVGDRFTLLVQAGLFFSLVGDVALMFQHLDEFNFLIGLAAFLVAQICYAVAFLQNVVEVDGAEGMWISLLLMVLLLSYGFFFAYDLLPYLDEALVLPVVAYAIAISLMGVAAGFRFRRTFPRSFWMVFAGALLFIASDSLLARNRFARPVPMGDVLIMVTYAGAQFLIAAGCLVHVLAPEERRRRQALRT